jgi:hypothetical protein
MADLPGFLQNDINIILNSVKDLSYPCLVCPLYWSPSNSNSYRIKHPERRLQMTAEKALHIYEAAHGYTAADGKYMDFSSRVKNFIAEQASIFGAGSASVSQANKFVSNLVVEAAAES